MDNCNDCEYSGFLPLDWLPSKARLPNPPCYLIQTWRLFAHNWIERYQLEFILGSQERPGPLALAGHNSQKIKISFQKLDVWVASVILMTTFKVRKIFIVVMRPLQDSSTSRIIISFTHEELPFW